VGCIAASYAVSLCSAPLSCRTTERLAAASLMRPARANCVRVRETVSIVRPRWSAKGAAAMPGRNDTMATKVAGLRPSLVKGEEHRFSGGTTPM